MKKLTNKAGQHKKGHKAMVWPPIAKAIGLQALKESEERFRSIVLWSPDAIIVTDAKGKIEYINPAAEKVFNRKLESFVGKDFGLPLIDGGSTEIDIFRPGKDPGVGDMHVVEAEWLNGKAHLITIRDITERKQQQVQQQVQAEVIRKLNKELEYKVKQRTAELTVANKILEAFSYSVAHDLRAPLRAIAGFANILSEDYQAKLDDGGRRLIGVISNNVIRMGDLINDLLALSQLSRQEMKTVEVDMTELARSVCNELKNESFRDRVIEVSVKSLPAARADYTLTKQIFINLISNAMKFTSYKDKALIEIGGYDKGQERVYYVKDNGAGFEMQYVDKLFGVFQRLHGHDEFSGTGIGLAIVSNAVRRHGGTVWAEAEVDKGATFYFTLPKGGQDGHG